MPKVNLDTFAKFSSLHFIVLGLVVAVSIGLGLWRRWMRKSTSRDLEVIDRQVAVVLLAIWIIAQVIEFLPSRFKMAESLPIHICDLTGLLAAAAVYSNRWGLRAMLYYWGIGLSSQAVFQPDLSEGPTLAAFWVFWVPHGAILAACAYDLIGRRYRPSWRDCGFAFATLLLYGILIVPVDLSYGINYGYVGNIDGGPLDFLGPWPSRVFKVAIGVVGLFAAMTLPWSIRRLIITRHLSDSGESAASSITSTKISPQSP